MRRRSASLPPSRSLRVQCADCRSWFWVDDLHTWRRRGGLCSECAGIVAAFEAARQVQHRGVAVRYSED
jgi:hypothetical protein